MTSSPSKSDLAPLCRVSTADVTDRLNALLEAERRPHYRCGDYLRRRRERSCGRSRASSRRSFHRSGLSRSSSRGRSRRQPAADSKAMDAASRARISRWLSDCADYLELDRECVASAMNCVDRFVSDGGEAAEKALDDATRYQLLAMAALFVQAKAAAHFCPIDAEVLSEVSHGNYTAKEIIGAEALLLQGLGWRVCAPTPLSVAHHVAAVLCRSLPRGGIEGRRSRVSSVMDFAKLQLELAVSDYDCSVLRSPSHLALAAILNSMELLAFHGAEVQRFDKQLIRLTDGALDARSREVEGARRELRAVFDSQSDEVVGRARAQDDARETAAEDPVATPSISCRTVDSEFTPRTASTSRASISRRKRRSRSRRAQPSPNCVMAKQPELRL